MNYFNQLLDQARNLFMSMTPGSRVMAGLMLVAILVSSAFLVQDVGQGDMEVLFGGRAFKESELQLAETAMSNAGLREYVRDGLRIKVPKSKRDIYIKALAAGNAIPPEMGNALDTAVSGGNVLESLLMTKTRILEDRQRKIAIALERLPFVDKAFVTYDERREGFGSKMNSTASISVLPRNGRPLEEDQKRNIAKHVAASFAGLRYENISVMDMSSGRSLQGDNDPLTSEQQKYYQQKIAVEQRLREKALNLLVDYGAVQVQATVELDPILRSETEVLSYKEKPVVIQTSSIKKDSESTRPNNGGRPGTEPNALASANRGQSVSSGANEATSKTKESQDNERMIVGQETTMSEKIGLMEKSATFAVVIPISYYNQAWQREWQERNPGKAVTDAPPMKATEFTKFQEDIHKKIQATLASLLPESPRGVDGRTRVTVDSYIDMPQAPIPSASVASTGIAWFADNWQSLGMFFIAGITLLALRSFVASTRNPQNDAAFDQGFDLKLDEGIDSEIAALDNEQRELQGDAPQEEGEEGGRSNRARFAKEGAEIRSELSSVIKENPDMAATLLRTWIGGDAA